MKLSKQALQNLVSSIFAFLLTLLFVVLFVSVGFILGVYDNKSVTRAIYESNYYKNVYDNLYKNSETIIKKANLPPTVLADVITLDCVYIESKNYVDKALAGTPPTVKTQELTNKLLNNINAYLKNENVERTKSMDQDIAKLTNAIGNQYEAAVQLHLADDIVKNKARFEQVIRMCILISLALIAILSFFSVRLYKYKHRGIRYIVYALITSSLLTVGVASFLLKTKQYSRINVAPDYYKKLISAYLRWDSMVFIYIGCIGLVMSAALAYVVFYMKKRIISQ